MFLAYKDLVVYLSVINRPRKAVNFFLSNLLATTYIFYPYKLLETDNLHPPPALVMLPKFRSHFPDTADLARGRPQGSNPRKNFAQAPISATLRTCPKRRLSS